MKQKKSNRNAHFCGFFFRKENVDERIRSLILYGSNAKKVLKLLSKIDSGIMSYWFIWYHFARYQLHNSAYDLKQAYLLSIQHKYIADAWLLHIIARYMYEVEGQSLEGLRYLRNAIALKPLLVWQGEYAVLCYYTGRYTEARQYLQRLIEKKYYRRNGYLFSLYVDILVKQEQFTDVLLLYRRFQSKYRLSIRDILLFFKVEELFGSKKISGHLAKILYRNRNLLDDINYSFLLLYFLKNNNNSYADRLYQECYADHSLAVLARGLYSRRYQLYDVYAERQWYYQTFRLYNFIDHSFLLYINSGVSELQKLVRRLHYQNLQDNNYRMHYSLVDLWKNYEIDLFFLGEKVVCSNHFIQAVHHLRSKRYFVTSIHLITIKFVYCMRFLLIGRSKLPFGYYVLYAELFLECKRWSLAAWYYRKALHKLAVVDSRYREYYAWILVECMRILISVYLQYLDVEKTIKRVLSCRIFDSEHLTLLIYQAQVSKEQGKMLEFLVWQAQIEQQLGRRGKKTYS